MGGSQSLEFPGGGTQGYHVLRVQENSPGKKAGLEPFFDFIISICDTRLNKDNDTLNELLRTHVERPVQMLMYSSRTQCIRETTVTPSTVWGGQGLLGITIRFGNFEGVNESVWHILEVYPNSPAAVAGLRADSDYIIGADTSVIAGKDLFSHIQSGEGQKLKLYVYNTDIDDSREVVITPDCEWGGEGSLGCRLGYGYLHRIPALPEWVSLDIPGKPLYLDKNGLTEVPPSGVMSTVPAAAVDQSLTSVCVSTESPASLHSPSQSALPAGHQVSNIPHLSPNGFPHSAAPGLGFQHAGTAPLYLIYEVFCKSGHLRYNKCSILYSTAPHSNQCPNVTPAATPNSVNINMLSPSEMSSSWYDFSACVRPTRSSAPCSSSVLSFDRALVNNDDEPDTGFEEAGSSFSHCWPSFLL
ncbi:hypothetical protein WMY93_002884 [Mugilogobius chulae]|uniref:PDZ GRASP-type domain-containing protein n=1 Tax=Mugilogobius chulae TaxID=88201 RepID=A0AAW0PUS6_9GOBI